jgi:hypothetical protein
LRAPASIAIDRMRRAINHEMFARLDRAVRDRQNVG